MNRTRLQPRSRRGFSLAEVCVACALSTLLVWLVAVSYTGFLRSAQVGAARAELCSEGNLAIALLAEDLRHARKLEIQRVDGVWNLTLSPSDGGDTVSYWADPVVPGLWRKTSDETEFVAAHVTSVWTDDLSADPEAVDAFVVGSLSDAASPAPYSLVLTLAMHRLVENTATGDYLERRVRVVGALPAEPSLP